VNLENGNHNRIENLVRKVCLHFLTALKPDSLEETERDKLIELLHENLDLFVTDDNPELGFTRVVEHKILLKLDVVIPQNFPFERGKSIGFLMFPSHVQF
jgi:hypothetical protein